MPEKPWKAGRTGGVATDEAGSDEELIQRLRRHIKELDAELHVRGEELEVQNEELRAQIDELHHKNIALENAVQGRQRAEESLRLTQFAVDNFPDSSIWLSPDGRIVYVNRQTVHSLGYSKDELLSMHIWDIDPDYPQAKFETFWQDLKRKHSYHKIDTRHKTRDGRIFWVEVSAGYIQYGGREYLITFDRDITERRRTEKELHRQAALIDLSPDAIIVRKLDGTILLWSHGAETLYGWTKAEAIGQQTHSLIKTQFPEPLSQINEQLVKTCRWSGELIHTVRDGRKVIVQSWWLARRDEQGNVSELLESNVDITGLKRIENELRTSLENFSALANNIPQLAWMARPDGYIFWYNQQWFDYTGMTLEDMQGWGWQKVHHPDFVRRITDEWRQSLETGMPFDDVFPLRGKDGSYRWFLTRVRPVRDDQGKILRWFGTNTDITDQKRLENQLRDAKDRTELYLDIMGHDINNLNQVILTNLELISSDENLAEDQKDSIRDALNAARGSASIIDNVRKIQAINEEKVYPHPEDVNNMIVSCIREMPSIVGREIKINYTPREGLMILGSSLMKEVFCNLVNNAIKHSEGNITIDIKVDETIHNGKLFYDVSIADNGPGIPDTLKPKLFSRFTRGETKAHGRGLGLFIVKSLVEQAGGDVTATDRVPGNPSQGARFIVSLPACEVCK